MGCCKVGWKTKQEAEKWAIENNQYYGSLIAIGKVSKAVGAEWCEECKEWHMKHEPKKKRSFLSKLFRR